MTYHEIITYNRKRLPRSINWWPMYFYHFTDIRNALGIIEKGWIYARHNAEKNALMNSDNASRNVIAVSSSPIKDYARLYFRPKTPTQYHNEGYKPEAIRNPDLNASCPVPVFFFLDAEKVLNMDGVQFSETTCAGAKDLKLLSGEDSFSLLPFEKIYHEGSFSPENRDDIISHRQAEVVRTDGICLKDCLKGIMCRSSAEKQTFLYLLKTQYYPKYVAYRNIIRYEPSFDIFYNNGIFVRNVDYNGALRIQFNDAAKRTYYSQKTAEIKCDVYIYYTSPDGDVKSREAVTLMLDYRCENKIEIRSCQRASDYAVIEILFDGIMMYKNSINLSSDYLL